MAQINDSGIYLAGIDYQYGCDDPDDIDYGPDDIDYGPDKSAGINYNSSGSAGLLNYNSGYTDGIDYGSVGIDYA
jgi:hypothetical protein